MDMPTATSRRTLIRRAAIAAAALAALAPSGPGAAADTAAAADSTAMSAADADAAIPYLTVLQPLAVRRHGHIVPGRIRLRAIIAADGLRTTWSIRAIRGHGDRAVYHVVGHGTLGPADTKTVGTVVFGKPRSIVRYDVTAANADGGRPTPVMRARIA